MYAQNLGNSLNTYSTLAAQSISASTAGAAIDLTGAPTNSTALNTGSVNLEGQLAFIYSVVNSSGTTPTCVLKVQHSTDNSTWVDVSGATASLTTGTSTGKIVVNKDDLYRYARVYATLGGTSPVYVVAAVGVIAAKNPA